MKCQDKHCFVFCMHNLTFRSPIKIGDSVMRAWWVMIPILLYAGRLFIDICNIKNLHSPPPPGNISIYILFRDPSYRDIICSAGEIIHVLIGQFCMINEWIATLFRSWRWAAWSPRPVCAGEESSSVAAQGCSAARTLGRKGTTMSGAFFHYCHMNRVINQSQLATLFTRILRISNVTLRQFVNKLF